MFERMEFCPKCNGTRKMILSLGLMPVDTAEGRDEVLVFHRHCASCNSYVRSETLEHEGLIIPEERLVFTLPAFV